MEKKISAIYSALDDYNYNAAYKLTMARDVKDIPIVKALRAIALQRTGQRDEALAVCDQIASFKPSSQLLLETMMHVYKPLCEFDRAIDLYSNAVKLQPSDEGLQRGVFDSFCVFGYNHKRYTSIYVYFSVYHMIYFVQVFS